MNSERDDERLVILMVVTGVGLGALLGAVSALIDIGIAAPAFLVFAVIAMLVGALVGLIIGTVCGFVSGAYAVHARRRYEPARVARGIRKSVMGVITFFVGIAAYVGVAAGADAYSFVGYVVFPALTALLLGCVGSGRMGATYLRHEAQRKVAP